MKKLICSILCLLVVLYSFPVSVYASNFGDYCSSDVVYPTNDLPSFNSYVSVTSVIVYLKSDGCFYLCCSNNNTGYLTISDSSLKFGMNYKKSGNSIHIYKYDPNDSVFQWSSFNSGYSDFGVPGPFSLNLVSSVLPFKPVWCNINLNYSDSSYTFSVTPDSSGDSNSIYANFFNPVSGAYLNNVPAIENGGSDEPSEPGSVDLTPTNNLISSLGDKIDILTNEVIVSNSALSSIFSKVITIQSDLASVKSSVSSISSSVSQGGYIASRINTLQSDVGNIKNNVSTITSSVSEGGYIASRIITMQSDIAAIKTNTGNLNSALGDTGYIGSRVNTISNNLSQLITVLSTKLDTVNSNLALINQDLTRNANNEPATTLFKTLGDFYSSFNSFYNYFTNDFVNMWGTAMSMIYEAMTTFYNTTFPAFISTMNTRFEELYNVIIYGDKRGGQAIENEKQQVEEFGEDLDEVSSHLDDASTVIDGASAGVASYIQTFTDFYNGFTALNAGISAVFLFALVFIFVKKAIGR